MREITDFLFGPYTISLELWDKIFFWVALGSFAFGLIVLAVLFFKKLNPVTAALLRRIRNMSLIFGALGLIWSGFRYEHAIYLEWRFWYIALVVGFGIWKLKILYYLIRGYRGDLSNLENQALKQKYLSR